MLIVEHVLNHILKVSIEFMKCQLFIKDTYETRLMQTLSRFTSNLA